MAKVIKASTDSPHVKGPMTSQPVIQGEPKITVIMAATNNTKGRINKDPVGIAINKSGGRS